MSDGDWRPVLALGGIAALICAVLAWDNFTAYQRHHAEERQHAAQYHAQTGNEQRQATCVPIPGSESLSCTLAVEESGQANPYAEYDLRAQQDMAEWALGMLIASIVGVIVTGAALYYVVRSFGLSIEATKAAVAQAEIARKEFKYAERPMLKIWVVSDNIADALDPDTEVRAPWVRFTVKNIGKGTAIFQESMLELSLRTRAPIPEQENFWAFYYQDFGTLEPGECWHGQHDSMVDFVDFRSVRGDANEPYFSGLLRYRDQRGNDWETGFCATYTDIAGDVRTQPHSRFVLHNAEPYYFEREAKDGPDKT